MKLFTTTTHRDNWQRFLKKAELRTYKKGSSILLQDQKPEHLQIIKTGVVRVYNITPEGEERTISFDVAGEMFPFGWVFGAIETTEYFYQAWTEVETYLLKRDEFLRYLKFHPKIAYEFYANTANRFTALQSRVYALEQSRAADKVAYILLYLTRVFGKKAGNTLTELSLPLTQQELANFIGLTRETTSMELKKLERQKILILRSKHYQINLEKLRALLNES